MTDTLYTHDEEQVAATVRSYFADFVDNAYLNEQQESDDGFEVARWKQMTELGWTSVHLPPEVGGVGGSLVDAAIVARECGRAAFASPLLQTLRAGAVLTSLDGNERLATALSRIAAGAAVTVVAPPERSIVAIPEAGTYRLAGRPTVVDWLEQSDFAVVIVPVLESDVWVCGVVSTDDVSGRAVAVTSIDNERIMRLGLDGLRLPESAIVADVIPSSGAEHALATADLLWANAMVGGSKDVLERSVRYAQERVQFGQPIGAFQAVRHHLARMAVAADGARLLCEDALARKTGPDSDLTAVMAAALFAAGRSYVEIVLTAAQLHGGVGTTTEHILHHHFTRAKAMRLRSGKRANRLRELHAALNCRREGSLW